MEDKLAKQILAQMDMCTRMVTQQKELLNQWEKARHVRNIRRHFPVMDIDHPELHYVRVGRLFDGGYIMVDDFSSVRAIYSCGINDDVSWDLDIAERTRADIFMYDHTIDGLPAQHPKFHFFKTGITGEFDANHPELETLPRLIERNGHTDDRNMILKMDIEGAEYLTFAEIDRNTLTRFSQIVLELHFLTAPDMEDTICFVLEKLNATHQLVYVHANNNSPFLFVGGKILPETIEATYLRKGSYRFKESSRFFPTELDTPNCPAAPDIAMGYWGQ